MRVLIIDRDSATVTTLKVVLGMVWPSAVVVDVSDKSNLVETVRSVQPDAVVIDVALPGIGAIDVIKAIRAFSDVPIIVVTEEHDELVKFRAFEVGVDEYIRKPFDPLDFLVRFKAVIRRANPAWVGGDHVLPIRCGELAIDLGSQRVTVDGTEADLTPTEYRLLCMLARNQGKVVPYSTLVSSIWGSVDGVAMGSLRKAMSQLRAKVENSSASSIEIINNRGIGYCLQVASNDEGDREATSGESPLGRSKSQSVASVRRL